MWLELCVYVMNVIFTQFLQFAAWEQNGKRANKVTARVNNPLNPSRILHVRKFHELMEDLCPSLLSLKGRLLLDCLFCLDHDHQNMKGYY